MSIGQQSFLVNAYYKLISYDKIRFVIVGGLGFVVNYVMLAITFQAIRLPIVVAQVMSAEIALLATFMGNNFWAFDGHHHLSVRSKLVKFHVSAIAGLLINSTCVVLLVHYAHFYYGLALIIGSAVAMLWNYTLYKRFVFKRVHKHSR